MEKVLFTLLSLCFFLLAGHQQRLIEQLQKLDDIRIVGDESLRQSTQELRCWVLERIYLSANTGRHRRLFHGTRGPLQRSGGPNCQTAKVAIQVWMVHTYILLLFCISFIQC